MNDTKRMSKMQTWFNQRFPYGRSVWKFAMARRLAPYLVGHETLGAVPEWPHVEIPADVVEHIYRMGWNDAKDEAVISLKESKD